MRARLWISVLIGAPALLVACPPPGQNPQNTAETAAPSASALPQSPPPEAPPQNPSSSLDPKLTQRIDAAVRGAIARDETPGAVLLVSAGDRVLFHRAYGLAEKLPQQVRMREDTLFDLASLTKPIVTATSILLLAEQGRLRLNDRMAAHLPELDAQDGKQNITLEQLLMHTSGLPSSNAITDYTKGLPHALVRINAQKLRAPPGTRYEYSDLGYILLGAVVTRTSGQSLDVFAQKHLFGPLDMRATAFAPRDPQLKMRAAPTESRDGHFLLGTVHDPRANALGGVAGHAGLFSTAADLARFTGMLLHQGKYKRMDNQNGVMGDGSMLKPASVRLLFQPRALPAEGQLPLTKQRTLAWEVRPPITDGKTTLSNLGHTGFTGTSIWLYPEVRGAVILLTNRLHPDGKGNVGRLRGEIAALVAPILLELKTSLPAATLNELHKNPVVFTGLDVLKRGAFQELKHKRIGLVTHAAAVSAASEPTIDLLKNTEGIQLKKLFSPEHGLRIDKDLAVADERDAQTGLPILSLYGPRKRPRPEDLSDIDAIAVDLQDAGCRFYTYLSTLGYLLESAARAKKQIIVFDRPNPVGGVAVEGPLPEKTRESFTAYHPLPLRHGMTLGELARLFNEERKIGADLRVIAMEGWKRPMLFGDTGLPWIRPSPNMKDALSALLYPGIGLLETTNLSVGRGTDRPFLRVGAPFIDGRTLASALSAYGLPGLTFNPIEFTPSSSTHAGERCGGVEIAVQDPRRIEPVRIGLSIAHALHKLYPSAWKLASMDTLLANSAVLQSIEQGKTPDQMIAGYQSELDAFMAVRKKYLIYPDG